MSASEKNVGEIIEMAKNLSPGEKVELMKILTSEIGKRKEIKDKWMDMAGTGKEVWKGIDAAEYIKKERRSWD